MAKSSQFVAANDDAANVYRAASVTADAAPARLKGGDGGGTYDDMEARVAKLESDMDHVKNGLERLANVPADLATIKATLPHLATKAELAEMPDKASARLRNHLYVVGVALAALALIARFAG